jgi:hypothetical protein
MRAYFVTSSDMHWVHFGSYQRCFSLARQFVETDLDRVAWIGHVRPAENLARLLHELSSDGFVRIDPPKFLRSKDLKRAHRATVGKSHG